MAETDTISFPYVGPGKAAGSFQSAPRRMMELHREIIRLSLMGTLNNKEIAGIVGCSAATVNTVMKDGTSAEKLQELQARRDDSAVDFSKEVRDLVPEALRIYQEFLLDDKADPKNRIHVADQVLDRGGLPRISSISASVVSSHLSEADMIELKAAALDAARKQGLLVDIPTADEKKEG